MSADSILPIPKPSSERSSSKAQPDSAPRPNSQAAGTSRRGALVGILALLASAISCVSSRSSRRSHASGDPLRVDPQAPQPLVRELSQDLARLDTRAYSEEGIPVFLVCEDLTSHAHARNPERRRATDEAIRTAFRRRVDALPHLRPNASHEDIAKLIEIVAERDFGGRFNP